MIGGIRSARLGVFLNVGIGIVFIIAAVIVAITVNYSMRQQALIEAQSKARIILDMNLATHTYFSKIMKPSIFAWSESFRTKEYFDHTWMSSSYAIREIEKYFKSLNPSGYSFRDAAINARSPENEADEYESAFLEKLAIDKKLESESTIRYIGGEPYLVVLRKGEVMETSCLRCHSRPHNAPKGLTDYYGSERSFNRRSGDVISVVSLRIPLSEAYAAANIFSLKLSAILLAILACLFAIQYWLYRHYLMEPLSVMREKANEITIYEGRLGEQVPQPFGRELIELTAAFNEMSVKLRHDRDHMEELVNKRTEALRENEVRWRDLFTNSRSAIAIYEATDEGQDFIIRDLNPSVERIERLKRDEIVGRRVTEVFPAVEAFGLLAVFRRVWKTGVSESHDVSLYQDERISGWRENFVYRLHTGEIVAVYDDVTPQKQAEEEIFILNSELEQRVIDRTAQLKTSNKELEAFSYSVSHDLRAPLRSIDGFSQVLLEEYQDKPLDDTGKTYLERVRKATHHMGKLIEDMLKLSRLTRVEFNRESVDLSKMIRAIANVQQQSNPDRTVDVIVQEGVVVQGDPFLIRMALVNMLDNGLKFTGNVQYPRIEFGSTVRDGEPVYFVRDNGAGFDMAYVDKLFGPFQRLHSLQEFPGTGIGLATVKRVIDRHGGRIWAEGEVGKGATFYFTLPS